MASHTGLGMGTLEIQPEIADLIGKFIVRWSMAKFTLMMPLLVAMDTTNQEVAAAILSSTNSTEGKIKIVKTSIENMNRQQELKPAILKSIVQLEKLCPERNNICHHAWASDFNNNCIVTIDYRKAKNPGRVTVRLADDLRVLCNRTIDAAHAISAASGSLWITELQVKYLHLEPFSPEQAS